MYVFDSIIFVHGYGGTQVESWKAKGAKDPWPKTLLDSGVSKARVLAFGYNTDRNIQSLNDIVSTNHVKSHATTLLREVEKHFHENDSVKLPSRK